MFKRNQAVTIAAAAGRTETGRIVRADRVLAGWYIVRFDDGGGKLCIAASSLQSVNS